MKDSMRETNEPVDAVVYCDEAGNSGPNYVDAGQPFYVLAAWAIPHERIPDAAVEVEQHRQQFTPQASELKSSNLLRTERGKTGVISLVKALGRLGCLPFYVLAEKRYCIAGKIIETFLDPSDNPRVTNAFIPDTTTKQEIANTLYEQLTDDELNNFAVAYRDPSTASFEVALDTVVSAVRERINPELAELLEGCRRSISDIARVEASTSELGTFSTTLNCPTLASMFMMIELAGRRGVIRPRKFVHDESRAYESGFRRLFGVLRNAGDGVFNYPSGATALFPLRHVPQFETARSNLVLPIQAADVLAGSVRHWAILARDRGTATECDVNMAMLTLPALLIGVPEIAWCIGSDLWLAALARQYFRPALGIRGEDASAQDDQPAKCRPPAESASLLPAINPDASRNRESDRYRFELPIYALIGAESGFLYCLGDIEKLDERGRTAVLLFHQRSTAEKWLRDAEEESLTEPFEVRCFDVKQCPELLESLRSVSTITGTLWVHLDEERSQFVDLNYFIDGLERSLDRVRRAFASGIIKQIWQEHEHFGIKIVSMLTSDGTY